MDGEEVLTKIQGLAVTSWNYKGQDAKQFRHYGPVAQDFFAAFGDDAVGTIGSPTTITSDDVTVKAHGNASDDAFLRIMVGEDSGPQIPVKTWIKKDGAVFRPKVYVYGRGTEPAVGRAAALRDS